ARGGLEYVRLAEIGSDRGPVMVRTHAPFVPVTPGVNDGAPPNFSDPVVLVRAPLRVSFAYAGPDRVWKNTWRGEPLLPRAGRVRVRAAATEITLAASTATMIHVEIPSICINAKRPTECFSQQGGPQAQQQQQQQRQRPGSEQQL